MSQFNIVSIFMIAAKRLSNNLGLTASTILGLIIAVALAAAIPIYSEGVNNRLLLGDLEKRDRPPFAFMFRYVGAWYYDDPVQWDEYEPFNSYMVSKIPLAINLPLQVMVRKVLTDSFRIFAVERSNYCLS